MGNCLKTQLKEVVQNNNLPEFKTLKMSGTISEAKSITLATKQDEVVILSVEGNATIKAYNDTPLGKTVNVMHTTASTYKIVPDTLGQNTEIVVRLRDYYSLTCMSLEALEDFNILPSPYLKAMDGLYRFGVNTNVGIDLSDFVSSLTIAFFNKAHVSGLNAAKNWNGLTQLKFNNATSNETLNLNEMLDAMYNSGSGRTSGTLLVEAYNTSFVKLNGEVFVSSKTVTFTSEGWS